MANAASKDRFQWSWADCCWSFRELWKRDRLFIFIFVLVNLLIGQIGFLTSLSIAVGAADVQIHKVWISNIEAAALYTFAITLLTGSLAVLAAEVIDKIRAGEQVDNFEYKAFWSVIAGALIVLQSPLAGNLIARSSVTPPVATVSAVKVSEPLRDSTGDKPNLAIGPASAAAPASSASKDSANVPVDWLDFQVVYWLLSMVAAFQIFCLQRNPLTPDNFAENRTTAINALATKGEAIHSTSFGEQV